MKAINLFFIGAILCLFASFKSERAFKSINSMDMPALQLHDTAGNLINLSDIHGQFIYYDFWASWCHPCMGEMKPTKELQDKIGTEKVTWVFISYDKDPRAWKKAIKETGVQGIQLIASQEAVQALKDELSIYTIPFNIWATGNNKIVKYDAPHPSEGIYEKLMKAIDKYAKGPTD